MDDVTAKTGVQRKRKWPLTGWATLWLIVGLAMFAYIRLSANPWVVPGALIFIAIAETAILVRAYGKWSTLDIVFEAAYFCYFFALALFVRHHTLINYPGFLVPAVFYRPYHLRYGNRHLAVAVSLLICLTVLLPAAGLTTEESTIQFLAWISALFVAGLWIFCSKLWVWAFE